MKATSRACAFGTRAAEGIEFGVQRRGYLEGCLALQNMNPFLARCMSLPLINTRPVDALQYLIWGMDGKSVHSFTTRLFVC